MERIRCRCKLATGTSVQRSTHFTWLLIALETESCHFHDQLIPFQPQIWPLTLTTAFDDSVWVSRRWSESQRPKPTFNLTVVEFGKTRFSRSLSWSLEHRAPTLLKFVQGVFRTNSIYTSKTQGIRHITGVWPENTLRIGPLASVFITRTCQRNW